ncbi:hypothetical protein N9B22_02125 [bacterium]|nr:hypothetical protein [bacterium]MDA7901837.1 hypothetical protein [bacterium]
MAISLLLGLTVSLQIDSPNSCADDSLTATTIRKVSDFRKDLKVFMKLSKSQDSSTERIAIYNLCQLHREIARSPRFDESLQLQGMRVVIAKRLAAYSADFKNSLKRSERKKKKTPENRDLDLLPPEDSEQPRHPNSQLAETRDEALNQSNSSRTGLASLDESADEAELESSMWSSAITSYDSLSCVSGGPDRFFSLIGGHLAPPLGSRTGFSRFNNDRDSPEGMAKQRRQCIHPLLPTLKSVGAPRLSPRTQRNHQLT